MLDPLEARQSTAQQAYASLREAIVSGALKPDTRLYEQRLATELGVSRTPVREALAMLEAEELVVSVLNRGTIVRRVTVEEVKATYEVRAVLEGHGSRLAAERIGEDELARLRRLDEEMKQAMRRKTAPAGTRVRLLGELNADFHKTIAAAAKNPVLLRTILTLLNAPLYARAYYSYSDPLKRASISDHGRMIELLESRDPEACERFWQDHLYRGCDYLIQRLDVAGAAQ
jgi:DNA-binding GntR family transcriptional regulator